jgi:thiol-disulfide isomerase/thioredoxin
MTNLKKLLAATLFVGASVAAFANSAGDRLIVDIDNLKPPTFDRTKGQDAEYMKTYKSQYGDYLQQKNGLILQLFQTDPTNPKTADLMAQRWMQFAIEDPQKQVADTDADIDKVLSQNPPEAIKETGEFCKIILAGRISNDPKDFLTKAEAYAAKYPKSDHSPELLFNASFSVKGDDKTKLYKEIVDKYPDSKLAPMVKGALAQQEMIGKPFALTFQDAVGGSQINLSNMKGKVVLVDFWATWCGPCVGEMPHVKDIYSQYHSKGLEIVGVSLDEPEDKGGLTKLKDFVAKNQIPWPMYYQGNGWDSKFSSGWGIMSIPTMFIVDKQGNFQGATDARDPDFVSKLQKYLGQ